MTPHESLRIPIVAITDILTDLAPPTLIDDLDTIQLRLQLRMGELVQEELPQINQQARLRELLTISSLKLQSTSPQQAETITAAVDTAAALTLRVMRASLGIPDLAMFPDERTEISLDIANLDTAYTQMGKSAPGIHAVINLPSSFISPEDTITKPALQLGAIAVYTFLNETLPHT
jgi:hypothetical protein